MEEWILFDKDNNVIDRTKNPMATFGLLGKLREYPGGKLVKVTTQITRKDTVAYHAINDGIIT